MDVNVLGYRKCRFKPYFRILTWWKARRGRFRYRFHINAPEDCVTKEWSDRTEEDSEDGSIAVGGVKRPLAHYLEANTPIERARLRLKTQDATSFHDSIGSLDSVIDSQCTHSEEEISQSVGFVDNFLMEHLEFLSQSTQPQEVEVVYNIH